MRYVLRLGLATTALLCLTGCFPIDLPGSLFNEPGRDPTIGAPSAPTGSGSAGSGDSASSDPVPVFQDESYSEGGFIPAPGGTSGGNDGGSIAPPTVGGTNPPSDPTDPSNPTDPSDPSDPANPGDPTSPTDPNNPGDTADNDDGTVPPPGGTDPGGDDGGNIPPPGGDPGGNDGGTIVPVADEFIQNQYTERYDFLWVVDNSGSMSNIRDYMSQNLTAFVNVLEARRSLDWQMAVTTTDNFTHAGNLIASSGGVRVVTRSTPSASSVWASVIQRIPASPRSGWEQGLESGRSAIERFGNEFSRSNTPLIVTYITDEEDYSCASGCNISGAPEASPTRWTAHPESRYVQHFADIKARNNADVVVYPIVHLLPLGGDNPCQDDYGSKGGRYMSVQAMVGTGRSMSICHDQMAASFEQVARLTSNLGVCFSLTKALASTQGMEVTVDGQSVLPSAQDGYTYEAAQNAVCFNGSYVPQNGAVVRVNYMGR